MCFEGKKKNLEGKCPSFTTVKEKYLHNIIGDINLHLSVKMVQELTKALWKNGVYTIYTNGGLITCCEVQGKLTINKHCTLVKFHKGVWLTTLKILCLLGLKN